MYFYYQIYGLPIVSEIELPALIQFPPDEPSLPPVYVNLGNVPSALNSPEQGNTAFSIFNENECITRIPDIGSYYITDGSRIIVEPANNDQPEAAMPVYSSCISIALMQRNLFLMHVSGCFVTENEVLLLAAQSGTGKSATAAMLKQKGYPTFTDDTALLSIENGRCYARASYPETRMWKDTTGIQQVYNEADGKQIWHKAEKFAFSFADSFTTEKVEVKGIVFLEAVGDELKITRLKALESWQLLNANIYVLRYVEGMKKAKQVFSYTSLLSNTLPAWKATRPKSVKSFEQFSEAIQEQIIKKLT